MPLFFSYLFKLSISISVVYLFYQLVLRRLTFYSWNRFYLLCYTLLSFFIPFINITPVLEQNEMTNNNIVLFIPDIGTMNGNRANSNLSAETNLILSFTSWDWILIVIISGAVIMLLRLLIQLLSFKKIINKAELVSGEDVKLYQVNESITPFSFGKSVFINRQLHSEQELKEIIRHEFVHVKQRHTIDIIWAEILCILNWYNPFVWFIRKAMRQNLEFIADNKVLQSGIDKKQYQYLLLKVIGNNHFSIANQFNFSSLKKRIAMMNKMRSARVHLVKFLFVLPVIAVLLLAFRDRIIKTSSSATGQLFNLSGIVYDNTTDLPLSDVSLTETATGINTTTDNNGFYKIAIPLTASGRQEVKIKFSRKNYLDNERHIEVEFDVNKDRSCIGIFSLLAGNHQGEYVRPPLFYSAKDRSGNSIANPGYDLIKDKFESYFRKRIADTSVFEKKIFSIENVKIEKIILSKADTIPAKPVVAINSQKSFSGSLLPDSVLYFVNGKETTAEKIKNMKAETIQTINVLKNEAAINKYGQRAKNGVVEIILKPVARENKSGFRQKEDSLFITTDTISWNAEKKQLYFKGSTVLKNKQSKIEMTSEKVVLNEDDVYVTLDGNKLIPGKEYSSNIKTSYLVVILEEEKAFKKYGDKARNGAIEITTLN